MEGGRSKSDQYCGKNPLSYPLVVYPIAASVMISDPYPSYPLKADHASQKDIGLMRIQEAAKRYDNVQVITAYMAEMYGELSSALQ